MTFEEYLIKKKIDLESFKKAEPLLYENWYKEFQLIHPNSFTAQKLYLINPIRRKYILKQEAVQIKLDNQPSHPSVSEQSLDTINHPNKSTSENSTSTDAIKTDVPPLPPASKPARPVFKPKPKIT